MVENDVVALIMAGGSGTRFWPASRADLPKQFLKLIGPQSLIHETIDRIQPIVPFSHVYICAGAAQKTLFNTHLPSAPNLILEPMALNTAPCLMLSLVELLKAGHSPDTVMVVLPADHYIQKVAVFEKVLRQAIAFAKKTNHLVTLGITPQSAHTGYGYIEVDRQSDEIVPVKRFVEKPDKNRAETFFRSKNFFWNSGMFIWTLKALRTAFQTYTPEDWEKISRDGHSAYRELKAQPIDIAILEKATNVFMIPADIGWSDIGSWDALYRLKSKTEEENVTLSGETVSLESRGCLVQVPQQMKVALVGVSDLIVVQESDSLLVAARNQDQLVKEIPKRLSDTSKTSS